MRRAGSEYLVRTQGEAITIVSPRRWKLYTNGVSARLADLARQYGVTEVLDEKSSGVVVDVGANIGEFSLYCHDRGWTVFAVEPDPVNFAALRKNVDGTTVRPFQLALWKCEEEMTFYSSVKGADSSLIRPSIVDGAFTVRAVPLDRFAADQGIGEVHLLKADAEGAEPELLEGASETLARTRYVAIDCGPERMGRETAPEAVAFLAEKGFDARVLEGDRRIVFARNRAME